LLALIGLFIAVGYSVEPASWEIAAMLACAFYAIMLFWGWPAVEMNTSNMQGALATRWPWHRQEAHEFVEAIRGVLVQRQSK
jgi:hypothetical protein